MESSAGRVRQVQDLRQAEENQAPLHHMCRETQPAKCGVGQEAAIGKNKIVIDGAVLRGVNNTQASDENF